MKKILFLSIAYFLILNTCLSVGLGYAKDVSEKDVIKIEQEAQQKELESKKLQAQAIQLNLELSKIDKNLIALAKKIQSNEDLLSISEKEQQKMQVAVSFFLRLSYGVYVALTVSCHKKDLRHRQIVFSQYFVKL